MAEVYSKGVTFQGLIGQKFSLWRPTQYDKLELPCALLESSTRGLKVMYSDPFLLSNRYITTGIPTYSISVVESLLQVLSA